MTKPRALPALVPFAVVALIACTGCVPDVVWLPDSSGFIYTTTDWPGMDPKAPAVSTGELFHYDLVKKAARVIAKTDTRTIQPALSPDGKRIAIAKLDFDKGPDPTLGLVVYDLAGKELQRTKTVAWGQRPQGDFSIEKFVQLCWSQRGNKVLVFGNKHSGIWDLDADRIVMLNEAMPMMIGNTPQRPDGMGCLLELANKNIAFVDWDGKQSTVSLPADQLAGVHNSILYAQGSSCWTRWNGTSAVLTWKNGQLRLDTARLIGTVSKPDAAEWAWDGKEIQQLYTFPDGRTKVIVTFLKSYRDFRDAGLATLRVDLAGPEPGKSRTLIPETFHCGVYPAPNKELVALRYVLMADKTAADQFKDAIMVLNQKGEVKAEIEARK